MPSFHIFFHSLAIYSTKNIEPVPINRDFSLLPKKQYKED